MSATYRLAGFVSGLTFLVYLSALQNKFVEWDDSRFIYENPFIRSLNETFFKWAFLDFSAPGSDYWRPLSYLSHAIDYAIWGLNPLGHHLTNNIIHSINTFLVVLLVMKLLTRLQAVKLTDRDDPSGPVTSGDSLSILIAAGSTGLLFGLHPIHVESVAWVSERKDLLCGMFFLMSIIKYISYATYGKHTNYLLTLGLFVLALLCKPMAVTLPVVLLILDWYPFERIRSIKTLLSSVFEKIPFIALALALSIVTILAQQEVGALDMNIPLSARVLVAAKSLVQYVWNMAFPFDLSPYYPYPAIISLFSTEFLPSVVIVSAMSVLSVFFIRREKSWSAIWGYYVATLLPVLGIVQVGGQAMADRYTYLPSISPFLMAGVIIAWIFSRLMKTVRRARIVTQCGLATAVLLVCGISYLTINQISIWKDTLQLWSYVIEREPDRVPVAYNNRGIGLINAGRYHEAIEDFNKAIFLNPANDEAYGNRGMAFDKTGQLDNALADLDKAISLSSFYKTYHARGLLLEKKGEVEKALRDYKQAIALNPSYIEAYLALGLLYSKTGSYKDAIESFNGALAIDPDNEYAHYNLGKAIADAGRLDEALEYFRTAVRMRPDDAYYRNFLGILYGKKGLLDKSVEQLEAAVRLDPSEPAYRKNLDKALGLKSSK